MRIWALVPVVTVMAMWLTAADQPSSEVAFVDHQKMAAGFAKGGTFLDRGAYQLLTSHRVASGAVEVHAKYGDIMFVVEGSATIVTGGTVVDGKSTAPDEIRGASITGGKEFHLEPGVVIAIPAGTPHWFKQVNGVVNYFVVKPRMTPGAYEVTYFDAKKTAEGFAGGVTNTLMDAKIIDVRTGHRVKPGEVETHMTHTDIIYVNGGTATLVTGGTVMGDKKDNPDEPRGKSSTGGQTFHLVKGDVIVVPPGVPHWFSEATDYSNFLVKIRAGN